jgi:hypothetical protein
MATDLEKRASPEAIALAYGAILGEEQLPEYADPEVISRAIMERIIEAETFEDAFQPQTLVAWREMLNEPVFVQDFRLNRSSIKDSASPVYAVVDLARADGKNWRDKSGKESRVIAVTCGGRNVLVQLVKALEKGWLDKPVKLTSKQTGEGFNVLWLEAA